MSVDEKAERFFSHFFEYTRKMSEFVFEHKMKIYEESTLAVMEETLLKAQLGAAAALQQQEEEGNHNNQSLRLFAQQVSKMSTTLETSAEETKKKKKKEEFIDEADEFVYNLYSDLPSGFDSKKRQEKEEEKEGQQKQGFDPFLYGELSSEGVRQVAKILAVQKEKLNNSKNKKAVFVDLGSGVGKLVFEMALVLTPILHESIGVELDEERAAVAEKALARLPSLSAEQKEESVKNIQEKVKLVQGDMMKLEINNSNKEEDDDDVFVFCCGVAFDQEFCVEIVKKTMSFDQEEKGGKLIGGIFLFREWPEKALSSLKIVDSEKWEVKKISLSTSWMSEAPAFWLVRK